MLHRTVTPFLAALVLTAFEPLQQRAPNMNFFMTSAGSGNGANLGGLAGADRICQTLAAAAGVGNLTWRAYLSTQASGNTAAVNARDRIGNGPWYNFRGTMIARNVAELHSDSVKINKQTALNEKGDTTTGRGDQPNKHDVLTGSTADGRAFPAGEDNTCNNWTSSDATGGAMVGHFDRMGTNTTPPMLSWNSSHRSRGCGQQNLVGTGGAGLFYCFGT
jgi:hypothetical protein